MTIALPKRARIAVICGGVIGASIAHIHCRLGVPLAAAAHGDPLTKPLNCMNPHIPVLEDPPTDTCVRQQSRRDLRALQKAADPFIGRLVPFPKADPAPILQSNSLPNGKSIMAHLSKPLTEAAAEFSEGERVRLELTPYDFDQARILELFPNTESAENHP